mgnify:CR=1 FL=1
MADTFLLDIDRWVTKSEKRLDVVAQQFSHDLFRAASKVKPGKQRGGSVTPGFIPRDTGFLAGSAVFDLNGTESGQGENAYVIGLGSMVAGDTATLAWTAAYARAQHYKGWLWVENAKLQSQQILDDVIRRAKARVR